MKKYLVFSIISAVFLPISTFAEDINSPKEDEQTKIIQQLRNEKENLLKQIQELQKKYDERDKIDSNIEKQAEIETNKNKKDLDELKKNEAEFKKKVEDYMKNNSCKTETHPPS